jgi:glycosyltransferase involved in cell wall biosynthesis
MTPDPLVSVVIPARNEEADLPRALSAVAEQDFDLSAVEVVVVDGDSTDGTAEVAESILESIGLARHAVLPNPGGNTPSNLNRGLEWARGEYVVRIDARSTIPPDYLSRAVSVLSDRPDVVVVGGSQIAEARSDRVADLAIAEALNNPIAMGGSRYRRGARSGAADTVYLGCFRRGQLIEAGGWDDHFSTNQDFELSQRMSDVGTVWFESGLPVGYVPRESMRAIFQQYHRFGRWKAHYWRHTGTAPRARQWVLLVVPPLVVAIALFALRRTTVSGRLLLGGLVGGGSLGACLVRGRVRTQAWLVNALIAVAWWSGVVRGLVRDTVS